MLPVGGAVFERKFVNAQQQVFNNILGNLVFYILFIFALAAASCFMSEKTKAGLMDHFPVGPAKGFSCFAIVTSSFVKILPSILAIINSRLTRINCRFLLFLYLFDDISASFYLFFYL
ncbi:MAG: hypothetical protein R2875_11860 [Desulfobacterales bacterium]